MLILRIALWSSFAALLAFFVALLAVDYADSVPSLVPCESHHKYANQGQATEQCAGYRSVFFPGHSPIIIGVGRFANRNEGAIVGAATIILAIATVLLSVFTWRQWSDSRAIQRAVIAAIPRSVRPYPKVGNEGDELVACDVELTNAGHLAARNVAYRFEFRFSSDPLFSDVPAFAGKCEGSVIIAPGIGMIKGVSPSIPSAQIESEWSLNHVVPRWLYVCGRVEYLDGFRQRWGEFCFRYSLSEARVFTTTGQFLGIDERAARYHERGNRIDED